MLSEAKHLGIVEPETLRFGCGLAQGDNFRIELAIAFA